jgi:hypothetical protein
LGAMVIVLEWLIVSMGEKSIFGLLLPSFLLPKPQGGTPFLCSWSRRVRASLLEVKGVAGKWNARREREGETTKKRELLSHSSRRRRESFCFSPLFLVWRFFIFRSNPQQKTSTFPAFFSFFYDVSFAPTFAGQICDASFFIPEEETAPHLGDCAGVSREKDEKGKLPEIFEHESV